MVAVELAAALAAVLAIGFLGSNLILMIVLGAMCLAVAAFALVLSRPAIVVEIAIITMWFDSLGVGPVRTGRVVAALATFVVIARVGTGWKPPALLPRAWVMPALLFVWALLSAFWAAEIVEWGRGILELALGFIYGLIIMLLVEDEEHFSRSMKAWLWTGVPIAVLSYFLFRKIRDVNEDLGGESRITGLTGNANFYAALLAVAIAVTVVFIRRARTIWGKLLYTGVLVWFLVALVTTGSRSGLIAAGVLILYLFVTYPGLTPNQRAISSLAGASTVALGVVLAAVMNPDRYSLTAFFGDAGAGRIDLWNAAVKSIGVHPIQGFSIGGFRAQMLDILTRVTGATLDITNQLPNRSAAIEIHNTYLTVLLDLGIVGLTLHLLTQLVIFWNLWDIRRTRWGEWAWAMAGCNLSLMAAAVFSSVYNLKFHWMIVGVAGALFARAPLTGRADRLRRRRGLRAVGWFGERDGPLPERTAAAPMDLRMRYPVRWTAAAAALVVGVSCFVGAKAFGVTEYHSYARVLVLDLDKTNPRLGISAGNSRIQTVLNMARSDLYLTEVRARAGLRIPVDRLRTMIDATRPNFGPVVRITASSTKPDETRRMGSVLLDSLDALVEQTRTTSAVSSADIRSITPDIDPEYRGPLYLHTFDDPVTTVTAPRAIIDALLGAGLAALTVMLYGLWAHRRARLSTTEEMSDQLPIPTVATVSRPVLGGTPRNVAGVYATAAEQVEQACAGIPRVIATTANSIATLQSRTVTGLACAMCHIGREQVVLVDLDVRLRSLSRQMGMARRRGLVDVATGGASIDEVLRPLPRWRLPRPFRRLLRGSDAELSVLPAGSRRLLADRSVVLDESELVAVIGDLATHSLVVLNLPPVPGVLPVREILLQCDAVLVAVLDGWTDIEASVTTVDALEAAAADRVGALLIEQ
ncbi:MAG: O-antigen ligase family protein [Microthrixaceae bacterium]